MAYDYEFNAQGEPAPNLESPRKAWLHALVGDDFVGSVYEVSFDDPGNHPLSDADLKLVGELTQLRTVGLSGIPITGAGLEHLKALTQLKQLDIDGTEVTDAGLQQLQGSVLPIPPRIVQNNVGRPMAESIILEPLGRGKVPQSRNAARCRHLWENASMNQSPTPPSRRSHDAAGFSSGCGRC